MKVISVCDFFTYLRYIKDGLVKCDSKFLNRFVFESVFVETKYINYWKKNKNSWRNLLEHYWSAPKNESESFGSMNDDNLYRTFYFLGICMFQHNRLM